MPKKTTMAAPTVEEQIDAIMEEQAEVEANPDPDVYTHHFKTPFHYNTEEYTELTFDFGTLTGEDDIKCQAELRSKNITPILPIAIPEYLSMMAARACTYRNDEGKRTVSHFTLEAMPLRDFRTITGKARRFLM